MTAWAARLIIALLATFIIFYGKLEIRIHTQQVQLDKCLITR